MGFYAIESVLVKTDLSGRSSQAKPDPRPKNRVWNFHELPPVRVRRFPSQTAEPQWEAVTAVPAAATDVEDWLSNDPIGINGGLNQYVFCGNDPVNNTDPMGLWAGWASGEPVSLGESFVPVWGSGRQAINDFYAGNYGWGTANTLLAVSDLTGVGAIGKGLAVGAFKVGSKALLNEVYRNGMSSAWRNVRKRMLRRGLVESNVATHHWLIPQEGWGKNVPDWIKNHPANLMPDISAVAHERATYGNVLERLYYGTPTWAKVGAAGTTSYGIGLGLHDDDSPCQGNQYNDK